MKISGRLGDIGGLSLFYTDDFMMDVMGIQALPEILYHYTSIETLALMLANKTLRFSRLDTVNDPEEATATDLANAATLVFASCWTAQPRESLAMWRMYTPNMQGVRIAMPNNPFKGRHKPTVFEKGGASLLLDDMIAINREGDGWGLSTRSVYGPNKIYYTDDDAYRRRPCLWDDFGRMTVQLHDLGMVKNTYWAFEEEWRYKILASMAEGLTHPGSPLLHPAYDLVRFPVLERALFVELDESSFEGLEVLLGPCVTAGQELIVKALLAQYAPSSKLKRSDIRVKG